MKYKIICEQPMRGIERSLPYEFNYQAAADEVCRVLNDCFDNKLYHHRVETANDLPSKEKFHAHNGRK